MPNSARGPRPAALTHWALLGALGGLLVLAKPSGAVLLAGGAAWALWWGRRRGALRPVLIGGAVAAVVAGAVWLPWGVRNLATFGVPFYSTEAHDAWILEYREWENIYRVYAGRGDLPHPRLLVGYGFDLVTGKVARQFTKAWDDLRGGEIVPLPYLPLIVLGALVAGARAARLLGVVAAATVPYALFVLGYWHYEERYVLFLLPWAMLLAAGGLWWLHDRIAAIRGRALATAVATILLLVLLVPPLVTLGNDIPAARRTPSSVTVAEWVRANTPPDAVVMTRNPWELAFHSERQAVMIPYDDVPTIGAVAARYGVTYLQLDHLDDVERLALAPLYAGREAFGFRKVYELKDDEGTTIVLVYRFPAGGLR